MKLDLVKDLFEQFESSSVAKMKIEIEDIKLELEKATIVQEIVKQPVIQETKEMKVVEDVFKGTEVKSPIVGVFYSASSPDAKAFVEVGQSVKAGQVICIIEAMKVMNEIKAPQDGIVSKILIKDSEVVEYDQAIMLLEDDYV
ncbi:acetyl-CoA carboxylase biotin carboxyl carrier protein [Tannockella kyphosi]|uniref:acetyl-CoA carboxylase biotin carboxyl carrier protein n=1 Tax=Tannockella kyphosi TaxID=2899121 RepID=UPI002012E86B|nr:biotin/lipoyl-containing protein [Tannockella kyphosi]